MEIITSKTDMDYQITQYDLDMVNDYLTEVKKRSSGAARNHKHIIIECLIHINKPIAAITMLDVKRYFEQILDKNPNNSVKC